LGKATRRGSIIGCRAQQGQQKKLVGEVQFWTTRLEVEEVSEWGRKKKKEQEKNPLGRESEGGQLRLWKSFVGSGFAIAPCSFRTS